jgi:hypothetical protein
MNHLYSEKPKKWTSRDFENLFRRLVLEQEEYFTTFRFLLTDL